MLSAVRVRGSLPDTTKLTAARHIVAIDALGGTHCRHVQEPPPRQSFIAARCISVATTGGVRTYSKLAVKKYVMTREQL
jgi:hypothetical protein